MRANPVSSLFLEDCRVPVTNLLGRVGDGIKIGLATLEALDRRLQAKMA
jgi:butyryl-CoA dehydrogenase